MPRNPLLSRNFLGLLSATFLFGLAHSAFFLLPKFQAQVLGNGPDEIGIVASIIWFANVALAPLVGTWIDRRGRRVFAFAGACFLTISSLAFLWVSEYGAFLIATRIVHGIGFTLFYVAASTLAVDFAGTRVSAALGLFGGAIVSTNALGPLLAEWMAESVGWPMVFRATALAALGTLAVLSLVREPARPSAHGYAPTSLFRLVTRPHFLQVLCVSALAGATFGALFTFYQPWALASGLSSLSTFLAAYSLAAVAIRIALSAASHGLGPLAITRGSLVLYVLSSFGMVLLPVLGLSALGIAFGLAHGALYPALNALALENTHDAERGKVMAVFNASFNFGFSFGSLGLGFAAEAFGYPPIFMLGGAFSLAALGALARRVPLKHEAEVNRSHPNQ